MLMSAEQSENGSGVPLETGSTVASTSKLGGLGWTILSWWGAVFRALFICSVGVVGWAWIDPQSISDLPISQLTLKQIIGNILAVLLAIWCVKWFFEFPKHERGKEPRENPNVRWGQFGGLVAVIAVLAIYLLDK